MGLLEEDSLGRQLVNIGSFRLWMSSKTPHPVIQIVDGDEQNVRPIDRIAGIGPFVRCSQSDEECNRREPCRGTRQAFRSAAWPKSLTTSATELGDNTQFHFGASSKCG